MTCTLLLLASLVAIALAALSSPRAITAEVRRQLDSNLRRWQDQTGLQRTSTGLAGTYGGCHVHISDDTGGLRVRCRLALGPPDLEVFVNARLVPLGFTFVRPSGTSPSRWALARRAHLPLLHRWLHDDALFADLASFLQAHRARIRWGWLELEPPRPQDIRPLLDEASALTARLLAAWRQPRRAVADRWGLRADFSAEGWTLSGGLHGAQLAYTSDNLQGTLTATLPRAPEGLVVMRPGAGVSGERVGSPLLDHLLAIRCPPPHAPLHDPDLAGALLAAVLSDPAAEIAGGSLRIARLPDAPTPLTDALERVEALLAAWPSESPDAPAAEHEDLLHVVGIGADGAEVAVGTGVAEVPATLDVEPGPLAEVDVDPDRQPEPRRR